MSCVLLDAKDAVKQARAAGAVSLDRDLTDELEASFRTIISLGHEQHEQLGAGKRTKAHNLLLRRKRHQPDVLRFAHDFRVSFSKHQVEQDIRAGRLRATGRRAAMAALRLRPERGSVRTTSDHLAHGQTLAPPPTSAPAANRRAHDSPATILRTG